MTDLTGSGISEIPVLTGETRTWLIEGRARPDHTPAYKFGLKMMGLSKSVGDSTPVHVPDPNVWDGFIVARQVRGAEENATVQLSGRYALNIKSALLRLAQQGCPVDVQLHMGQCTTPSDYESFEKVLILEDARVTTYSTEDLGALSPDERSKIDETADVSATVIYEVVPLVFSERAKALVTTEVIDVVFCDSISCGNCDDESDGCEKIFALTTAAGGSGSTPADVVFSLDSGATWAAHDVDSLLAAEVPNALACVGDYIVVVSNETGSAHIALKSEFLSGADPAFAEVTAGFVAGGEPNDIWSVGQKAFIVGDFGYVYLMDLPTAGVTVLDAGEATVAVLNAVHALSENAAVAVGNDGAVIFTENGSSWGVTPTNPVALGVDLLSVWMKNMDEWFVTAGDGTFYYTLNQGLTWTAIVLPGTTPTLLSAVAMATNSVMYVSGTVDAHGRMWRSIDGGESWSVMLRNGTALPLSDTLTALAACTNDPDMVVGVGLADDGADGYIVLGEASES